jgi:hypothetical protein
VQQEDAGKPAWPDLNYLGQLGLGEFVEGWAEIAETANSVYEP